MRIKNNSLSGVGKSFLRDSVRINRRKLSHENADFTSSDILKLSIKTVANLLNYIYWCMNNKLITICRCLLASFSVRYHHCQHSFFFFWSPLSFFTVKNSVCFFDGCGALLFQYKIHTAGMHNQQQFGTAILTINPLQQDQQDQQDNPLLNSSSCSAVVQLCCSSLLLLRSPD